MLSKVKNKSKAKKAKKQNFSRTAAATKNTDSSARLFSELKNKCYVILTTI
jgi:hypothetical protein